MSDTESLCQQILLARESRDTCKTELADATKALDTLETELAEKLIGDGEKSVVFEKMQFSATTQRSWKTRPEGKQNLLEILKESAPELVKESVHASTLNSYLKKNADKLESAQEPWWINAKDCLESTEKASLSVKKGKTKK